MKRIPAIEQRVVLRYENAEHRAYVELLIKYGFSLILGADRKVGRRFIHPIKLHEVELDLMEDDGPELYEPKLRIWMNERRQRDGSPHRPHPDDFATPIVPDHYNEEEWRWLTEGAPSAFIFLSRELQLWMQMRPAAAPDSAPPSDSRGKPKR